MFLLPDEEFRRVEIPRPPHQGMGVHLPDPAIVLEHVPTGFRETCEDFRSQIKNYERARERLEYRVLEPLTRP